MTGQGAETGRDQRHSQGGLGWAAETARVAQSQGTDLYGFGDNILLKAAEYTALYNLGNDVPYDPKFYRCEAAHRPGIREQPGGLRCKLNDCSLERISSFRIIEELC